jgi:hypothetical protein
MTRRRTRRLLNDELLEQADASQLELVDHVLNRGVMITGDLVLGLAQVDLVYVRLSALLCAADRVLDPVSTTLRRSRRRAVPERPR